MDSTVDFPLDKTRIFQNPDVFRYSRKGHMKWLRKFRDGAFPFGKPIQQRPTSGVAERMEDAI